LLMLHPVLPRNIQTKFMYGWSQISGVLQKRNKTGWIEKVPTKENKKKKEEESKKRLRQVRIEVM